MYFLFAGMRLQDLKQRNSAAINCLSLRPVR